MVPSTNATPLNIPTLHHHNSLGMITRIDLRQSETTAGSLRCCSFTRGLPGALLCVGCAMIDSDSVEPTASPPPSSLPYTPSTFGRKRPLHSSPHHSHTHSSTTTTTAMSNHSHSHSSTPSSDQLNESLLEAEHFVDVIYHFEMYAQHSLHQLHRLEADFRSIPAALQHTTPTFLPRLAHLRSLVLSNHAFLRHLTAHRGAFMTDDTVNYPLLEQRRTSQPLTSIDAEKMSKIRSTLRQCTRDWSADGARERATCYSPILKELERLWPERADRRGRQVLVPGCGLGRLVWEVSRLGFDATGNEFSYFMLLCSYVVLNECRRKDEFTIYPYVHDSRNVMKADDQTREVKFPDVDVTAGLADGSSAAAAAEGEWMGRLSMVAGDFMDIYSEDGVKYRQREKEQVQDAINRAYEMSHAGAHTTTNSTPATPSTAAATAASMAGEESDSESDDEAAASTATTSPASSTSSSSSSSPSAAFLPPPSTGPSYASSFDAVTTCFFIDCSNNILACLQTIAYILKPGGYWINFGPLLYHYSDMPHELSVELTWEEVKLALPAFGLKVLGEKGGRQSGYCVDERSMQRSYFYCVECTCQKVGGDTTRGEESGMVRKKTRRGKGKKARGGSKGGEKDKEKDKNKANEMKG